MFFASSASRWIQIDVFGIRFSMMVTEECGARGRNNRYMTRKRLWELMDPNSMMFDLVSLQIDRSKRRFSFLMFATSAGLTKQKNRHKQAQQTQHKLKSRQQPSQQINIHNTRIDSLPPTTNTMDEDNVYIVIVDTRGLATSEIDGTWSR